MATAANVAGTKPPTSPGMPNQWAPAQASGTCRPKLRPRMSAVAGQDAPRPISVW